MFKKNVNTPSRERWSLLQTVGIAATTLLAASLSSGCRLLPPLPSVDLKEPGWSVKQGQAVWRFAKNKPEIAGEILLATKGATQTYVQFTKGPFTMMTGQITPRGWQIELADTNKRYSAPGKPNRQAESFCCNCPRCCLALRPRQVGRGNATKITGASKTKRPASFLKDFSSEAAFA